MDDGDLRLDASELADLRDAVRRAADPGVRNPRAQVLDVHAAVRDARITVDLAATEVLGMPMVVVQLPGKPAPRVLAGLTDRENEVAALVAAGFANKEIGARLGIQLSTVKEHVHRILTKTGLPSRSAVARAFVERSDRRHGGAD